ncbi:hypothetical protein G7Y89_g4443 [Cudoniella acicularis]|uniref:Uncharacterized protein n=1 Tax=Cudoniella acicularis TaxID=354080 RepID=A0A8H4W4P6_9HELO|nr:hypothetical protein G7Y89_g4443 [Cudoniella acicularis]
MCRLIYWRSACGHRDPSKSMILCRNDENVPIKCQNINGEIMESEVVEVEADHFCYSCTNDVSFRKDFEPLPAPSADILELADAIMNVPGRHLPGTRSLWGVTEPANAMLNDIDLDWMKVAYGCLRVSLRHYINSESPVCEKIYQIMLRLQLLADIIELQPLQFQRQIRIQESNHPETVTWEFIDRPDFLTPEWLQILRGDEI